MARSINEVSIFGEYKQSENRLTAAFLQILKIGGEELIRAGERIVNLERILNQKMGIGPDQDVLPPRFTEEPLQEGACAGEVVYLQELLGEYYAHRNWPGGVPSAEKRKELGLDE